MKKRILLSGIMTENLLKRTALQWEWDYLGRYVKI